MALGRATLNKYYRLTDDSEVYRIAMVLHPEYKLKYFKDQDWDQSWIDDARDIVRRRYDDRYAGRMDLLSDAERKAEDEKTKEEAPRGLFNLHRRPDPGSDDEDDELDRYLNAKPVAVNDPIKWWIKHRPEYPRLARMALDYHTIPATSVGVERVFSRARRLIGWERNRLSAQSIQALMCLGSWSRMGYVANDVLDEVTKDGAVQVPQEDLDKNEIMFPEGYDRIHSD